MALLVRLSHAFLLGSFGADPIGRLSDGQISLGTLAAVLIVVSFRTGTATYLLPPAFCYLLLYAGFASPLRCLAIRTDLSYGIYIYAFPLQQVLALAGLNRFGVVPFYLCSVLLTLPAACLSWYVVERPCLRLKGVVQPATSMAARAAPGSDAGWRAGGGGIATLFARRTARRYAGRVRFHGGERRRPAKRAALAASPRRAGQLRVPHKE